MELVLEENRAFKGKLFLTTYRELKIKKMKGHTLSEKYNKTKLNNVKKEERF